MLSLGRLQFATPAPALLSQKTQRRIQCMVQSIAKPPKRVTQRKTAVRRTSKLATSKPDKTSGAGRKRIATEPDQAEIAEREAVARTFFNPTSARAARAAFLKR